MALGDSGKYDELNKNGQAAYKFWRMGSSASSPSRNDWNFIKWWGEYTQPIYDYQKTYDTNANIVSNENRENILKQAGQVQTAYNNLSNIQDPGGWLGKLYNSVDKSLGKYIDWTDKNLSVRPGVETQPEFANETRLNAGGNALGNNLRGRATSLKTLQDKRNSLDNILRALENKRTENSLNLSKVQEEAKIGNLNRQLAVESKYGQYKINDINRDSSSGLWNNIIGAGMSTVAGLFQKSKTDSLQEELNNLLKGGSYKPTITPADYTFTS